MEQILKELQKMNQKIRVDRITEHSRRDFWDVGARQNINKLISTISISIRRAVTNWR